MQPRARVYKHKAVTFLLYPDQFALRRAKALLLWRANHK
jgi:hypothetical protein